MIKKIDIDCVIVFVHSILVVLDVLRVFIIIAIVRFFEEFMFADLCIVFLTPDNLTVASGFEFRLGIQYASWQVIDITAVFLITVLFRKVSIIWRCYDDIYIFEKLRIIQKI